MTTNEFEAFLRAPIAPGTAYASPSTMAAPPPFPSMLSGLHDGMLGAAPSAGGIVAAGAGLLIVGIAATAGVGALVGMGVAAAVAKGGKPAYGKGAAIGAGAGLAGSLLYGVLAKKPETTTAAKPAA